MNYSITKPKNMNSPSYDIIVLILIHILPSEFMFVSEDKVMNNKLCCSCKDISFSTKFLCSIDSYNLHLNCVNIIFF